MLWRRWSDMRIEELTVAEVARRWGRALEVFSRNGIDACCGGDKPVAEAARLHNVPLARLLAELAEVGVPARAGAAS
jgi:iron-sulfur cluster repair protein YtfE (RIC family)